MVMRDMNSLTQAVEEWADLRGLTGADPYKQMAKLMEEIGELAEGLSKSKRDLTLDGIGDSVVVLIILAKQVGSDLRECLDIAYTEIKDRKGKMINGVFVKESDLHEKKSKQQAEDYARALELIETVRRERFRAQGNWWAGEHDATYTINWDLIENIVNIVHTSRSLLSSVFGVWQDWNALIGVIEKHESELEWYFTEYLPSIN